MHIERHVFGSLKGYTTLAKSPGISAEDARQLESGVYGFGQTEDRAYAKSLRSTPAYFTRVLRGNRRGLTRVFEGRADVAGRATDLMITVVLGNTDWDGKLYGDISLLLNDATIWKWTSGSEIDAIHCSYPLPSPTIPRRSVEKIAALISEIERRWPVPSPIIVAANDFGDDEIRAVEALIPPANRPQFTSACHCLSPQLAVTLNQLAAEAPVQTTNFRYDPASPKSPYAQFLLSNGLASGRLPIGEVITYRHFGQTRRASPVAVKSYPPPPPMPIEKHRRAWMMLATGAIIIAAALAIIEMEKQKKLAPPVVAVPVPHVIEFVPPPASPAPQPASAPSSPPLTQSDLDQAKRSIHVNTDPAPPPLQTAVAQSAPESQQDKDLKKLERDWKKFFGVISRESLTFDESQMNVLGQLEDEMKKKGLVHRVELESTNSVAMLPLLRDMRDQYVEVNSLLSDDRIKNTNELALAERQLEESVKRSKEFLRSLNNTPAVDSKVEPIFATMDAAIAEAKLRLKEPRKE